jgi:hypothetical protein
MVQSMSFKCLDCKDTCVYVGLDETRQQPCQACCPNAFCFIGGQPWPQGPTVSGEFVSVPMSEPETRTPLTTEELAQCVHLAITKGVDPSPFLATRRLVHGKTVDAPISGKFWSSPMNPTGFRSKEVVAAAVMGVPGVRSIEIREELFGQVEAIVDGGDAYEIAVILRGALPWHVVTVGDIAVTVQTHSGNDLSEVRFSRPSRRTSNRSLALTKAHPGVDSVAGRQVPIDSRVTDHPPKHVPNAVAKDPDLSVELKSAVGDDRVHTAPSAKFKRS